jgi:hypothetical protein
MRCDARTKLGSCADSPAEQEGGVLPTRGSEKNRSGRTHSVLKRLSGQRSAAETGGDGRGKGEVCRGAVAPTLETGLVLIGAKLEHGARSTASGSNALHS